ncbi:nitric-oxide synthase [Sphingomonas trueperi]|uniref:nitric oxide synthase oxygenase n=1 Tax=Sphingomonas trueperi TaxID=53317 RepID=UPI003398CE49
MVDRFVAADPVRRRMRRLSPGERREEALVFLDDFARETGQPADAAAARRGEVARALRRTGTYAHTPEELAFGARVAWRNHARCIGRLWWKSLEVRDCRAMETPEQVAAQIFAHMEAVFAGGRIRSCISIFSPAQGDQLPVTVESAQVLQYAGYLQPDGSILGDRQNVEFTRTAIGLGWKPPEQPGAFDLLPLILRDPSGFRHFFSIPDTLRREVAIRHPDYPELAGLGLRWYSVPCVSNMHLTIGGIEYPCAPFNGHYMGTEIASRDFADRKRYDLLPRIAEAMGFAASESADPLWRDRTLTELNAAVLHSYRAAGVEIVDHHTASEQFMEFVKREQREGRTVSADWAWIVPPQASAACPVFHLGMEDLHAVPNFFVSRAVDGNQLRVNRRDRRRNKWLQRYDRLKRRWWNWQRQRDLLLRR